MKFNRTITDIENDENVYARPECELCQEQGTRDIDGYNCIFCSCLIGFELNKLFAVSCRQDENIDLSNVPVEIEDYKALFIAQNRADLQYTKLLAEIDSTIIDYAYLTETNHGFTIEYMEAERERYEAKRKYALKVLRKFGITKPFDPEWLQDIEPLDI